jgi:hypothetical protein
MLWQLLLLCILILVVTRNTAKKSKNRVRASSSEALHILASLIAQFHINKINQSKKIQCPASDTRDYNNDQSLS